MRDISPGFSLVTLSPPFPTTAHLDLPRRIFHMSLLNLTSKDSGRLAVTAAGRLITTIRIQMPIGLERLLVTLPWVAEST